MFGGGKKKRVLADLKLFTLINGPVQGNYMLITRGILHSLMKLYLQVHCLFLLKREHWIHLFR